MAESVAGVLIKINDYFIADIYLLVIKKGGKRIFHSDPFTASKL
jgi:hypothetical protein